MAEPKWVTDNGALIARIAECEDAFVLLIRQRLGIYIHEHQRRDLQKVIVGACKSFDCSPQDYLLMLKEAAPQSPALDHLVAGITVGETYFFRDKNQMQVLEKILLPKIIEKKRKRQDLSLRIWSAGCATGEEIYTIAMLLHEMLPDIDKWTLNLFGTDINTAALHNAIVGSYAEWSMRSIEAKYKDRYFVRAHQRYQLSDKIRDLVRFDYLNLNEDEFPSIANGTNTQDLILCRNVLIYFDSKHVNNLMKKLSNCLTNDGYLMLGASDPVDIKSTLLDFHKEHALLFSRMEDKITPLPIREKPAIKDNLRVIAPVLIKHEKLIQKQAAHVAATKIDYKRIDTLLAESKWHELLMNLSNTPAELAQSAKLLVAQGTALANLGQLTQAADVFRESFKLDVANQYAYLTYAFTLSELNQWDEAEVALKKAIYLDHQFVAGHYLLGLLYLRNKKITQGIKCLKNALMIAKNQIGTDLVPGRSDLSYSRLADLLQYEIELYSGVNKGQHDADTTIDRQKA